MGAAGRPGGQDGVSHPGGLADGLDIVDAKDVGAADEPDDGGPDRPLQPVLGRGVENPADEALARDAQKHGAAKRGQVVDGIEQGQVVLDVFAEADARVEDDRLGFDAGSQGGGHALGQESADFGHHVAVPGHHLHGLRRSLHVHQDEAGAGGGGELEDPGVPAGGADVVDDVGPGGEGGFGHLRLGGVHGQQARHPGPQSVKDGQDAPQLFFDGHGIRTGP